MNTGNTASNFGGLGKLLRSSWKDYGGFHALIRSPYLMLTLVTLVLTVPVWTQPKWWEIPLQVLPGLIGFTIGGYAISASVGDDDFKRLMAGKGQEGSLIRSLGATFTHFITIEVFAVLAAIIAKGGIFSWLVKAMPGLGQAWLFESPQRHLIVDGFWAAGFGLFLYGLSSALVITMSLLRVTQSLDKYHATEDHKDMI